jgi:hypothetical protein
MKAGHRLKSSKLCASRIGLARHFDAPTIGQVRNAECDVDHIDDL